MNRFYISAVLFLLLIISGIASVSYLNRLSDNLNNKLDAVEEYYYIDADKTKDTVEKTVREWESKKVYLAVFLNHEALDEISSELVTLAAVCNAEQDSFLSSLNSIRFLLDDLIKANSLSVYSFI